MDNRSALILAHGRTDPSIGQAASYNGKLTLHNRIFDVMRSCVLDIDY